MEDRSSTEAATEPVSPWGPLRRPFFRSLWIAGAVSNIGGLIQSTATAWLMTTLAPSAVMVSLVQTAISLPIFLLALPAGALADVVDRRRLIILTQGWMLLAATALGALTLLDLTTPWILLTLTLLLGLGHALNAPAWQAIVPELVSRPEIPAAVALNSAGFNLARSIGPALGGLLVGLAGAGFAFLTNAVSFLGVMIVLFFWKREARAGALPAEHMLGAVRTGIRYVRHAPAVRSVLVRTGLFILCASALSALLPIYARFELGVDSVGYGLLQGAFGFGAVVGAAFLPGLRRRVSLDTLAAIATFGFAAAPASMAFFPNRFIAGVSMILAGAFWLALLSTFNSSVQATVPSWVRGRALAVYMLVFFGGLAGGSFLWGTVASFTAPRSSLVLAAAGLALSVPLTRKFKLISGEHLDLTPSGHWPVPAFLLEPGHNEGPVLVTVEYLIDPEKEREFGLAMRRLRRTRLRGGAFRWNLFADTSDARRYLESFMTESWIEHLRQHERVTVTDREIENLARAFHIGSEEPKVNHYVAKTAAEED